jgi:hypothetical protein
VTKNGGTMLLKQFQYSLSRMLCTLYPDVTWNVAAYVVYSN